MLPAFDPHSRSLVKKHLTPLIAKSLLNLKTDSGFTLEKAIASGIHNPDSSVGIYAGDAQSYDLFGKIFSPIICDYHQVSKNQIHQADLTPPDLICPDPEKKYIRSTRIRVARNLDGFNFPCHMDLALRRKLETKVTAVFSALKDDLEGSYFSLEKQAPDTLKKLNCQGLIFEKGDRFQEAAGFNKDFPKSRGVFCSTDTRFRVWVNEEDHLRIMSMEQSGDLSGVFNRLCRGLKALEHSLAFARNRHYGFLASCPTNIGTAMRAGVHIRLKKLEHRPRQLEAIAKAHQLQIRGTAGEKTKVKNAIFDISNARRLGVTESEIIQTLNSGIQAIIQAEEQL